MKVLVNKFKTLVNKKGPTKYHKQAPVTPPGYVNPFKHQQEIEEKRQQQIRLQHQQAIDRLKAQQELEALSRQQAKLVQPQPTVLPTKPAEPPKAVHVPKLPKRPSFFDKKVEITIKKPHIKLPKFKKPELNILKFTPPEPKVHPIEQPAAPVVQAAKPQTEAIKREIKKSPFHTLHLPKIKTPKKFHEKQQFVFAGVIVGAVLLGVLYFSGFAKISSPTNETPQEEQTAVNPAVKVAEAVSKKTTLPKGEEPVSATVTDRNKLQNQEFFSEAQNGDKILMYKQAKKAYLYRPSTDEVIAIAPLVFQDTAGASTTSAEAEEPTPTADPNAPKTSIAPEPPHGKVLVPARY